VDFSTWSNGSIICQQAISFQDPVTGYITGQIYYAGFFPAFVESGYVLLAVIGGVGNYAGAQGQLLNGQNQGGFSFQYHLWYSTVPAFTPTLVQYTTTYPSVPTPPSPSPTPPSPSPSPPSPSQAQSVSDPFGPLAVAAIVIAIVCFFILVIMIIVIKFGIAIAPATQSKATLADDRPVTLESPRDTLQGDT